VTALQLTVMPCACCCQCRWLPHPCVAAKGHLLLHLASSTYGDVISIEVPPASTISRYAVADHVFAWIKNVLCEAGASRTESVRDIKTGKQEKSATPGIICKWRNHHHRPASCASTQCQHARCFPEHSMPAPTAALAKSSSNVVNRVISQVNDC